MRWPAWVLAIAFLGYAAGKAVFAAQGRLGFPGGPPVSAAEHEAYAREMMDVATVQWLAVPTGLAAAALVLATVTALGSRIPRVLMLAALGGMLLTVGAGAGIMAADGFFGLGVGWRWYHGVVGLVLLGLMAHTVWSYVRYGSPGAPRTPGAGRGRRTP
ncbi:hypothetical protein LG943_07835 [Streptomonospora sp. S1-112]|uniref:Uncharacterized protein n=1 Tax=Streptomonospora mangrovi TaxID=2883123 RepID=A0A9X3NLY7_9ACTN|nr:hypothetical protein [Streptomonospora mangrovi]MDA0564234.1 hypothetical protein [Streptomonospora mangrovi]